MSAVAKIENLKDLIVVLRGESVLLDSDVAEIYGVGTKRINEAVKNNPDKFPHDYMFEISEGEFADLRSKFSTTANERYGDIHRAELCGFEVQAHDKEEEKITPPCIHPHAKR
jgi:hypothetical protein